LSAAIKAFKAHYIQTDTAAALDEKQLTQSTLFIKYK
jgi:hypothetical protein